MMNPISKSLGRSTSCDIQCCGCASCVQRCPKQCILLSEDGEGFLYPRIDESLCVDCGLCEQVCPVLNPQSKQAPLSVVAAKNRSEQERMASSSGGVFLPLARDVIKKNGVVFGAVFDEAWEVKHVCAERMEEVFPMMGSKYLQSRIGNTYREAETFLKQGRDVMFVGTPCQIAGLRAFLRHKEYPNLLAVDFVCHGVPSPGVWRQYLAETYSEKPPLAAGKNTVLLSSLNAKSPIGDIKFRDKCESGWKKYRFVVRKKSASKADKNSVLSSDIYNMNPFMRGFLSNLYLRPSCHNCKCKQGTSHSDITIADFWGIHVVAPHFDDDKGVSLVLVNTEKGKACFARLGMDVLSASLQQARRYNGAFNERTQAHSKRDVFFTFVRQGQTIKQAVAESLYIPLYKRALGKAVRSVKAVLNALHL